MPSPFFLSPTPTMTLSRIPDFITPCLLTCAPQKTALKSRGYSRQFQSFSGEITWKLKDADVSFTVFFRRTMFSGSAGMSEGHSCTCSIQFDLLSNFQSEKMP